MQIISPEFLNTIRNIFSQDTNILATIRYEDEWTKEFTEKSDVLTLCLTTSKRTEVENCLDAAIHATNMLHDLTSSQIGKVFILAKQYLNQDKYIQFRKLFNNAIPYVFDKKVKQINTQTFEVQGRHAIHLLNRNDNTWLCDCDLFNGRGMYIDNSGECSHVQACMISFS